ncbi:hypothetical protein CYMTET_30127 [Cymbomonas tetramitiformis]|uniref:Uncharacterized protein n=1 Tax=Cymbomonas tetramitiformis TaxID=36881 RepID=A0AAE0KUH4_9CHLO|nr:hypothetical protein CYMTET_30127 [Cymbomonas tetramitiformis]
MPTPYDKCAKSSAFKLKTTAQPGTSDRKRARKRASTGPYLEEDIGITCGQWMGRQHPSEGLLPPRPAKPQPLHSKPSTMDCRSWELVRCGAHCEAANEQLTDSDLLHPQNPKEDRACLLKKAVGSTLLASPTPQAEIQLQHPGCATSQSQFRAAARDQMRAESSRLRPMGKGGNIP